MSSDLLFRSLCCSGYVMMASFSCKQSMHLFVVLLYAGACFRIDHDILGGPLLFLSLVDQTNFDREVLFSVAECVFVLVASLFPCALS